MTTYLIIKYLHILFAVVVAGTGAGIAFFMWMASRSNNLQAIVVTTRHVVLADWLFTAPSVLGQIITGVWLMVLLDYSFTSDWFLAVTGLYLVVGACWIPVVFIQYELRQEAERSLGEGVLSDRFNRFMRVWMRLGVIAFGCILVIFWLMVGKWGI